MSQNTDDISDKISNLSIQNKDSVVNINKNLNDFRLCGLRFVKFDDFKTAKNFLDNCDIRSFKPQYDHPTLVKKI